jgi:hypothetical protein
MVKSNLAPGKKLYDQIEIALWGPSQSGKDWLIRGFIKELNDFNRRKLPLQYSLYEVQSGIQKPVPIVLAEPPVNIPTSETQQLQYIFKREPIPTDDPAERAARQISAQEHSFLIDNNKGAFLVEALIDPIRFESIYGMLLNAHSLILVLGIPKGELVETPDQPVFGALARPENNNLSADALDIFWSRETYLNFIQRLFACLVSGPPRNVAVCMTKVDQLGYKSSNSWDMLEYRHGSSLRRLLERHADYHNIEVFATTSAGYIQGMANRCLTSKTALWQILVATIGIQLTLLNHSFGSLKKLSVNVSKKALSCFVKVMKKNISRIRILPMSDPNF